MFDFLKKAQPTLTEEEINKIVYNADCFYFGKNGCNVDKAKALRNYETAAQNGNVYSQLMAGYMYDFGDGVTSNISKAIEWYTKASEVGDANATLNLANIYLLGRNVAVNKEKGILILQKAAEQGSAIAASSLGREYTIGDVLPQSLEKAVYWIEYAEANGYINSQTITNLGLMYESEKMYEKAFECFEKAVDNDPDDTNAQYLYAQYKFYGRGTESDIEDAKNRLKFVVDKNPNDQEAKELLQMVILRDAIFSSLEFTLPVLKSEYYIYDYHLGAFAGNGIVKITLSFSGNNYQKSENWKKLNSIFYPRENQLNDNDVTFEVNIELGNKMEQNYAIVKNIFNEIIPTYTHITFADNGQYITAGFRN